ncbi:hypothetical protein AVL50_11190 [Flammeovirga sp. SJP92]|nr:hypothetical protein AVL50_11190 [Flammeovirga sp. SJP92]
MDVSINFETKYIKYYGNKYLVKKGFYEGDVLDLDEVEKLFAQTRWDTLNNHYDHGSDDDETVSILFIKNGKIIKFIDDYGGSASIQMRWAYAYLLPFINNTPLTKVDKVNDIYPKRDYYTFNRGDSTLRLTKAEGYFLYLQLQEAKTTNKAFKPKYSIELARNYTYFPRHIFGESYEKMIKNFDKVETDGRYYKIFFKNGQIMTYDIGYNYITENNISGLFYKKENEY